MNFPFNALGLSHKFMKENLKSGAFCIDGTAGRGRDTLFLAQIAGENGRVLAFDIQKEAVESTRLLLEQNQIRNAQVHLCCHSKIDEFAQPNSVDGIMFNIGWLPGGDHDTFSTSKTSLIALEKALELLKPGGVMSLCLYYGKENGTEERDAILDLVKGWDQKRCSVLLCDFINRASCPPIAVLIEKDR